MSSSPTPAARATLSRRALATLRTLATRRPLRALRARLVGAARRLLLRRLTSGDPWELLGYVAPVHRFGTGARRDFAWYFEGESAIAVATFEELVGWLATCEYASDAYLFQERDFWQHPRTFEQLRRGDCEDFALWAWRKLVELGYEADFVVGRCLPHARGGGGHAWVMLRRDGVEYLFEPAQRDAARVLLPLDEVRERYLPAFGVGSDLRRFTFVGALLLLDDDELHADAWRERRGHGRSSPATAR